MDLKHAIADLKYVERFVRSLTKVIGAMEQVEGLEQKETEAEKKIGLLIEQENEINNKIEIAEQELQKKRNSIKNEVEKINETVQIEKDKVSKPLDEKIIKKQNAISALIKQEENLVSGNAELEKTKKELKKRITISQNALKGADSQLAV